MSKQSMTIRRWADSLTAFDFGIRSENHSKQENEWKTHQDSTILRRRTKTVKWATQVLRWPSCACQSRQRDKWKEQWRRAIFVYVQFVVLTGIPWSSSLHVQWFRNSEVRRRCFHMFHLWISSRRERERERTSWASVSYHGLSSRKTV